MNLELTLTDDQLGEIARRVVHEMEKQGKVMAEPERVAPWPLRELEGHFGVSEWTLRKWVEAGRLQRVPGTSKVLFTAASVSKVERGEA